MWFKINIVIFIFFLRIKKSKNENIKYKKKSLMVLNIKNNDVIFFSFLFGLHNNIFMGNSLVYKLSGFQWYTSQLSTAIALLPIPSEPWFEKIVPSKFTWKRI